ncbi:MAG TPA: hypothetical protein DCR17_15315 [Verrucomicrobiales bacterium]|nr:hypothetical protein [Verrucomicrobiales bacterium]HBP56572.1 hypothetical protein [Verrucomicrobiales bacterium]HCZ01997.1 hypothetical protein [Verrucomicrobiales bacterium]
MIRTIIIGASTLHGEDRFFIRRTRFGMEHDFNSNIRFVLFHHPYRKKFYSTIFCIEKDSRRFLNGFLQRP